MPLFVSLKLSKAVAALPLRGQLRRSAAAEAVCRSRLILCHMEPVQGPLLPETGGFFSDPKAKPLQGTGFRAPRRYDWEFGKNSSNRLRRPLPGYFALKIWSSRSIRQFGDVSLSETKGSRNLPLGDYEVFPRRECIAVFQRRAHALTLYQSALKAARMSEPSPELYKVLRNGYSVLRGIIPHQRISPRDHKSLWAQLGYRLRQLRKLTQCHGEKPYEGDCRFTGYPWMPVWPKNPRVLPAL
jgi:hypothetical protein